MLTVDTAATEINLTTRDAVKAELAITNDVEDVYLDGQISQVTDQICDYLGIRRASDGTRTLGRETLVETFRAERSGRFRDLTRIGDAYARRRSSLSLARWPVLSVASVVENGVTLDSDCYETNAVGGLLRLSNGESIGWPNCTVVVTYTAGWLLPGQDGRNLPYSIEAAAISMIKAARFCRDRDPAIKKESMLQRTYEYEVFAPDEGNTGIPADALATLDRYRRVHIG